MPRGNRLRAEFAAAMDGVAPGSATADRICAACVELLEVEGAEQRWPQFVPTALRAGFSSVYALPMRLHDTVLGTLGLFGTEPGHLNDDDLHLGQALAATASLALVAERNSADKDVLNAQLHAALQSRVALEQAKGLLAHSGDLDMEQAFTVLRRYARDHNLKLSHVAAQAVDRTLAATVIIDHARRKGILEPTT